MIKQIYVSQKEQIDEILKDVEKKVPKIEDKMYQENRAIIEEINNIYNIKINAICEAMYEKGFKDGVNLMVEVDGKLEV